MPINALGLGFFVTIASLVYPVNANALTGGDLVRLLNPAGSKCLHVRAATENREGGRISVRTCQPASQEQRWQLHVMPFPIGSTQRYFRLRNVQTQRCLNNHSTRENRNGGRATVTGCTDHPDQQWELTPTPTPGQLNTRAQLRNRGTGRCLNLDLARDNIEGGAATVFDCAATAGQNWRLIIYAPSRRMFFQNMGLMVAPVSYGGRDRELAIRRIIQMLRQWRPDVVGLAEVYSDSERERIRTAVGDIYPLQNFSEGPDRRTPLSDGGLLMLSRHPVIERSAMVFDNSLGVDRLAHKGVLRARIRFPDPQPDIDVYLTHLQDPDATSGALDVTVEQIGTVRDFVERTTGAARQAIIMGDINIDSLRGQRARLVAQTEGMMDLWTRCDSRGPGITLDAQRDFSPDSRQRAIGSRDLRIRRTDGQRVDYFFQWPTVSARRLNCRVTVITDQINIPGQGRFDLSDHYGLFYTVPLN